MAYFKQRSVDVLGPLLNDLEDWLSQSAHMLRKEGLYEKASKAYDALEEIESDLILLMQAEKQAKQRSGKKYDCDDCHGIGTVTLYTGNLDGGLINKSVNTITCPTCKGNGVVVK